MALSQVRRATRAQQPVVQPRQKSDDVGKLLGVAQGVGALVGGPIGAGVAAGAGLLNTVRDRPQQTFQQPQAQRQRAPSVERIDTGPAISRRLDLASSGTDPVADLLEAQKALQQLPEEQRRQFEKPIGLALAEQQRRFS